jgi:hypothetical protein
MSKVFISHGHDSSEHSERVFQFYLSDLEALMNAER